jgi:hypothetical protein
LWNR